MHTYTHVLPNRWSITTLDCPVQSTACLLTRTGNTTRWESQTPSRLGGNDSRGRMQFTFTGILILFCCCSSTCLWSLKLVAKSTQVWVYFYNTEDLDCNWKLPEKFKYTSYFGRSWQQFIYLPKLLFSLMNFTWQFTVLLIKLAHTIKQKIHLLKGHLSIAFDKPYSSNSTFLLKRSTCYESVIKHHPMLCWCDNKALWAWIWAVLPHVTTIPISNTDSMKKKCSWEEGRYKVLKRTHYWVPRKSPKYWSMAFLMLALHF